MAFIQAGYGVKRETILLDLITLSRKDAGKRRHEARSGFLARSRSQSELSV